MPKHTAEKLMDDPLYKKAIDDGQEALINCVKNYFTSNSKQLGKYHHGGLAKNMMINFIGNMSFNLVKEEKGYPGYVACSDEITRGIHEWFENALSYMLKELKMKNESEKH